MENLTHRVNAYPLLAALTAIRDAGKARKESGVADDAFMQCEENRVSIFIVFGVLRGEVLIDELHLCACLIDSYPRRQSSIRSEKMNASMICCDRVGNMNRRPRFGGYARRDKSRRHDTNDVCRLAADR